MKKEMKSFIITIDTEGDNLWQWDGLSPITTENVTFIPRFQELCERYGFIPTYLCNWETVNDNRFVSYFAKKNDEGKCEIGMHLHAWNTPPYYDLPGDDSSGKPFLIEYPEEILREKIVNMTNIIDKKFGRKPVVHRAGRWAMDRLYFKVLKDYGYIADCSVTPGIDWSKTRGRTPKVYGTNYSNYKNAITTIEGIVEVPVSTIISHRVFNPAYKDRWDYEQRRRVWMMRPNGDNLAQMKYIVDCRNRSASNYIEFMIHSSELMPGGSPYFRTNESIDILYSHIDKLFSKIAKCYQGIGLGAFAMEYKNE